MHIDELCDLFGLKRSTIHWYRHLRVLSPPVGHGRWARYTDTHVRQLRLIRDQVHDRRVTLRDMAERLTPVPRSP